MISAPQRPFFLLHLMLLLVGLVTGSLSAHAKTEAELLSRETPAVEKLAGDARLQRIEEIRLQLVDQREQVLALDRDAASALADDARALKNESVDMRLAMARSMPEMVDAILALVADGKDVSVPRRQVVEILPSLSSATMRVHDEIRTRRAELQNELAAATGEARVEVKRQINRHEGLIDEVLAIMVDVIAMLEGLDLPSQQAREWAQAQVGRRARLLAARIHLATARLADLETRLDGAPGDADLLNGAVRVASQLQTATDSLEGLVALMEDLNLASAAYHEVLLSSTGELTSALFDRRVAGDFMSRWISGASDSLAENGPGAAFKTLLFALLFAIFWGISRVVRKITQKAVQAPNLRLSSLLKQMLISLSSRSVLLLGLLVALSQLGIEVGPILAGLGIIGFVVGFALQDTLSNFAAGVMILVYRPFDVEDLISCAGGVFGTVNQMNLVSTTVLTLDNQTLVVPNGKIWGDVITNVTAQRVRRVDLVFGISYSDDIPQAEAVLCSIVREHPKVLQDPAAIVKVHELGDSSVNFVVRPWVARDDYWDVHWDMTREVKLRFDREGISIPFPQRDVHFPQSSTQVVTSDAGKPGDTELNAQDPPDSDD